MQLRLCEERHIRDALLVKQKLGEMGVQKALDDILVERGYITKEGIEQVQRALKGENRLGGFELLEKIGQGAMGTVFQAKQVSLDRLVAVKVLPRSLAEDPAFVDRFLREARNVARLNHPNIIRGIDVGEDRGYYYFAMEYVDGPTVKELLEERGPLAEKEALRITLGVARALEHAWHNQVLHRDIKPANIMLTADNTVKLCDLGLATALEAGDADASSAGKAVGTPSYISPEQARGRTDIDTRSDIYSLGATLYHLLTGHPPFEGFAAAVVLSKHVSEKVTPIASYRPDVSRNTVLLMARMMAKEPGNRHQSATEVIADIEDTLAGKVPRRSVRFRAESTLPLPSAQRTGHHTAVAQRKIQTQRSSANAVIVFFLMLVAAIAAVAFFVVLPAISESGRPPHRGPREPPAPLLPATTLAPIQPPQPAVVAPAPASTPAEPVEAPAAAAERKARQLLARAAAAPDGSLDELAPMRKSIGELAGDNNISAPVRAEAAALLERIEARCKALEHYETLAGAAVRELIASGDFATAHQNILALERNERFSRKLLAELTGGVKDALQKRLASDVADIQKLLRAGSLAEAARRLEQLETAFAAAAAALGLDRALADARAELARAQAQAEEKEVSRLLQLADAFDELRRSVGERYNYDAAAADLPADLPQELKNALRTETLAFHKWLNEFTRILADLPQVRLQYRGGNLNGTATFEAAGRLKIRTPQGLIIGISMHGIEPEQLRSLMYQAGRYDAAGFGRLLLFLGHDAEAVKLLSAAQTSPELALLVKAVGLWLKVRGAEREASNLLQQDLQKLSLADCAAALGRVEGLLAEAELPADLRSRLETQAQRLRELLINASAPLVAGTFVRRAGGVEILYETSDPGHLADWRGIDGRQWRYMQPGLEAVGRPGVLASGLLYSRPVTATLQFELLNAGELELELAGVTASVAAGNRGRLSAGAGVAALPPLSPGRHSLRLAVTGSRAAAALAGQQVEVDVRGSSQPAPIRIAGSAAKVWAIRLEGAPVGAADSAQERLAAARRALADNKPVTWPIEPGMAGWLAINGQWEVSGGYLRGSGKNPLVLAAFTTPTATAEQRLSASFTYRLFQSDEPAGHGLLLARLLGGNATAGYIRKGAILAVAYKRNTDRHDLPGGSGDADVNVAVDIFAGSIRASAKGTEPKVDIKPHLPSLSAQLGFQTGGAPAGFRNLKVRLSAAEE